jgi:tetratricopeptide (TPR) repeat protein
MPHVSDKFPPGVAGRIWLHHAYCGTPGDPRFIGSVLRAIDLAGRANDTVLLGTAHLHASYLLAQKDRAAADMHFEAARALLIPAGRTKHVASLMNALGGRHHDRDDSLASRACYGEAIEIALALEFERGYAAAAANLIDDKFNAGEIEAAISEMSGLVERCRRERTLSLLGLCLFYFGDYLLAADRHAEASAIACEGIALNRSLARHAPVNACIETAALAAALSGNVAHAARLAGYVKHFYEQIHFVRGRTQQRTWTRLIETIESRMPADDVRRLMRAGSGWTEEHAAGQATAERSSGG